MLTCKNNESIWHSLYAKYLQIIIIIYRNKNSMGLPFPLCMCRCCADKRNATACVHFIHISAFKYEK